MINNLNQSFQSIIDNTALEKANQEIEQLKQEIVHLKEFNQELQEKNDEAGRAWRDDDIQRNLEEHDQDQMIEHLHNELEDREEFIETLYEKLKTLDP